MIWKIGILGLIHDHVWDHIPMLAERPDVVVSVADRNEPLLSKAGDEYGIDRQYHDPADLLEREQPDAVLVFADNAGSADLVDLAASHGKPIMVEKPMADSLANAERMRVAANRAGVPMMINWPTFWSPAIRHVLDLAQSGVVDDIYRFSFRGGHGGPRELGCSPWFCSWLFDRERNGAGAYTDYCGYGVSMSRLLLGIPSRVQATIGRLQKADIVVDDNAVLLLRYHDAMAVIEATWTASGPVPDAGPTVWGRRGTLVVERTTDRSRGKTVRGDVVRLTSQDDPDGRIIEPPDLPEGERNATEYFLSRLASDRPIEGLVSLEVGLDTQEILEAGLLAAESGSEVSLPLR